MLCFKYDLQNNLILLKIKSTQNNFTFLFDYQGHYDPFKINISNIWKLANLTAGLPDTQQDLFLEFHGLTPHLQIWG